jgi:hypothetical protein
MAKTTRPMVRIHNIEIDEVIDREMNDLEFKAWKADQQAQTVAQAEADAKELAKAAILDRIGLTADEAKLLLG